MRRIAALGSILVLLAATATSAVDFEVTTGGMDTASCGVGANPKCKTITYAVGTRATGPSDKVLVGDGTYDTAQGEMFPIIMKDGVSVIGNQAMPQNVVVTHLNAGPLLRIDGPMSATTTIAGLTLAMATTTGTGLNINGLSSMEGVEAVIEDNRFVGGLFGLRSNNNASTNLKPVIRDNLFSDQFGDAIFFRCDDSGASRVESPLIQRNTITDPGDDGIAISLSDEASGAFSPTISDNMITGAGNDGVEVYVSASDTDNVVSMKPLITKNTIMDVVSSGVFVEAELTTTAQQIDVTLEPTITDNTVDGTDFGDGILVEASAENATSAVISIKTTITGNEVRETGSEGIDVSLTDFSEMSEGTLSIEVLVSDNTVADVADTGIQVELTDFDSIGVANIGPIVIANNTVTGSGNRGMDVQATEIASDAFGFQFSPDIKNNTLTGNGEAGLNVAYTSAGAVGTAEVSSNVITGNDGSGVELVFLGIGVGLAQQPACVPGDCGLARAALRGNTVTGNGLDAVKIFGGTTTTYDSTLMTTVTTELTASGDYFADLGGGFKGGDGLNVFQGNTTAMPAMLASAAFPGTCAGGAYCDINNLGPIDVQAQCNEFTETDLTLEEQWLHDYDDDPALGQITPISICQVLPTPTPTPQPQPPVITEGNRAGSTEVCGTARPDLGDMCLQVVLVGPPEQILGTGGSDGAGEFCIDLSQPLAAGGFILVRDICLPNSEENPLDGPTLFVAGPAPAPALGASGLALALLALLGVSGLAWRRRMRLS